MADGAVPQLVSQPRVSLPKANIRLAQTGSVVPSTTSPSLAPRSPAQVPPQIPWAGPLGAVRGDARPVPVRGWDWKPAESSQQGGSAAQLPFQSKAGGEAAAKCLSKGSPG